MDEAPSIRVQTVLYKSDLEELTRAFDSVLNALRLGKSRISDWTIAYGDSSPVSVLSEHIVADFSALAIAAGGRFEYSFFAENLGHGGGHNRLHASAEEDLLLILNPDGILAPDTISRLVDDMTPETGVLDARQLPMEHPKQYDPESGEASWSSLACALTPSSVFRQVGGIDHDTFFMYCDDVDYSWRVRLAGYRARYCPQARMFHDKRLDGSGNFVAGESERYYSAEAALLLAYKYSRDDLVETLDEAMKVSDDPYLTRARAEFNSRRVAGQLPVQIDADHKIAVFAKGNYGQHRF